MAKVYVVSGDITQVRADALITAINSQRDEWFGAIDNAIYRVAGDTFHRQAAAVRRVDGAAIVAHGGTEKVCHFRNVVFVIDDLRRPLHEIVAAGLAAADGEGFGDVTLPAIRMGVAFSETGKTAQETIDEIAKGVQIFLDDNTGSVESVTFVVYHDKQLKKMLADALP